MSKDIFNKIRLEKEQEVSEFLESAWNASLINRIFNSQDQNKDDFLYLTSYFKGYYLPLSTTVGSEIFSLFYGLAKKIGFSDKEVKCFIVSHPDLNAFSLYSNDASIPHIIALNSKLFDVFNQNELAFVIAHELAHLFYKHSYIDSTYGFLYPQEGEKRCPLLLFNSYLFWQKLAEISADRLALFLIGDLETSIRAIVKLSSGLADKHLKLNISSIIDFAVENFKDMNANQMEYFANKMNTEHPANPMRIVALNRFYNSGVMKRILEGGKNEERDCLLDGLDEELTEKLERYPANEEESTLLFFVIAAGIMIMNACEGFSENGFYYLSNFASNYYLFSMDLIQNMMEDKNLQETMEENAKIIREKYPELKYHVVAILVELMLSDKRITDEGEKMLTDIALEHLQFDPRVLNDILVEKLKFFFRPFEE